MEGLPFLLTCAASFGCQRVYAANLCYQLGMQHSRDSNPGLLLMSVLEMHNSWKEIYISKMNFMNPEINFKN
jgi:hypothetical protein